ncbi:MAG: hypothetical protein Ct9H300mP7_6240 [Verrucomicrobiota bacterium]|nr:MAG: hypothetical protein Ct9H300mP7_6240 [Verrucomicrobiota bacterium]
MATVPRLGSSHYFAVFAVVGGVAMGMSPTLWGLMIDIFSGWSRIGLVLSGMNTPFTSPESRGCSCSRALWAPMRLGEPRAARLNEFLIDLIRHSPLRYWMRS